MTEQEQKAFTAMREALENIAGDKWPDPEMTAEEYAREALTAANAVQPQAQGVKLSMIAKGFINDTWGRTIPTITITFNPNDFDSRDKWFDAHPQATEPAGYKLVPVEPTPEMWKAVNKLDDEMAAGSYDGKGCTIEQAWNCMLAAAPEAP